MKRASSMTRDETTQELTAEDKPDETHLPGTAGALLRTARQSQGLDIATLAALLKVPAYKLQALEQDRSDLLADPVFARALASSLCRILKLDPAPVLQQLPAITAFKVNSQNRGINTPFRTHAITRNSPPFWSHVSRPAIGVGLTLLLGALVIVLWPSIQQEFARYWKVQPKEGASVQEAGPSTSSTMVVTPTVRGNDTPAAVPPALSPAEPVISTAEATPLSLPSPLSAPELPATGPVLFFNAKATSKIKVTDVAGLVVFDRLVRGGESISLAGALPMTVVVSQANAVQVQVRGQPFELAGVTKNNIANFEVK